MSKEHNRLGPVPRDWGAILSTMVVAAAPVIATAIYLFIMSRGAQITDENRHEISRVLSNGPKGAAKRTIDK